MDEVESLRNLGYCCYTVLYGRNDQKEGKLKKVFATVKNALRLLKEMKQVKPDFVYLNSRFEPIGSIRDFITLRIVRLLFRNPVKFIIKSHGSDCSILTNSSFFYRKVVIPFLSKTVDAWVFLSSEEKCLIAEHNPEMAARVHVIPNIIDPERCFVSDIKNKYKLAADRFICLYAGRLVRVKGVFEIVESISHLKNPENFQFVFVGDGPDSEELRTEASRHPNGDIITFTGFLPDAECDQFYGNADVLIYPTADTEGFAMALFKSVACGVPVITTRVRAAKDYLKEPNNTIWVEPQRPEQIAAALETIYENEGLREAMRKNNQQTGEKFSPGTVGKQLKQIIEGTHTEVQKRNGRRKNSSLKQAEPSH